MNVSLFVQIGRHDRRKPDLTEPSSLKSLTEPGEIFEFCPA